MQNSQYLNKPNPPLRSLRSRENESDRYVTVDSTRDVHDLQDEDYSKALREEEFEARLREDDRNSRVDEHEEFYKSLREEEFNAYLPKDYADNSVDTHEYSNASLREEEFHERLREDGVGNQNSKHEDFDEALREEEFHEHLRVDNIDNRVQSTAIDVNEQDKIFREEILSHHPNGFEIPALRATRAPLAGGGAGATKGTNSLREEILDHHPNGFFDNQHSDKSVTHKAIRMDVIITSSVVALICFILAALWVCRKRHSEKKISQEVHMHLSKFDLGDVDLKRAITGGYHGVYKNGLAEGDNSSTDDDDEYWDSEEDEEEFDELNDVPTNHLYNYANRDSFVTVKTSPKKTGYNSDDNTILFMEESPLFVAEKNSYLFSASDDDAGGCSDDDVFKNVYYTATDDEESDDDNFSSSLKHDTYASSDVEDDSDDDEDDDDTILEKLRTEAYLSKVRDSEDNDNKNDNTVPSYPEMPVHTKTFT